MIIAGKLLLMGGAAVVGLLALGGGSSGQTPARKPGGLIPITPLGKIPPGGDRPRRPSPGGGGGGGGGAAAHGPDPEDPRVDANMPAALKAATIALLDNPNATVAQLRAGAAVAQAGGFVIAAQSLTDLADEHEQVGTDTSAAIAAQQAADAAAAAAGQRLNPGAPITADPSTDPELFAAQMQAQLDAITQAGQQPPPFAGVGGQGGAPPPGAQFDPSQAPSGFDANANPGPADDSGVLGILGF